MASKSLKTKKNTKSNGNNKTNIFTAIRKNFQNETVKFVMGILLIAFALFMTFAYFSFFWSGAADSSKLEIPFIEYITESDLKVENVTGKFGALFSDIIINRWFGIASISIIFMIYLVGFRLLGAKLLPLRKTFLKITIITIWLSTTIGFFMIDSIDDKYLLLGGAHGHFVSDWLRSAVGTFGTFIIIVLTFIIYTAVNFGWFMGLFKRKSGSKKTREKKSTPKEINKEDENENEDEDDELENEDNEDDNSNVVTPQNTTNPKKNPDSSNTSGSDFSFTIETPIPEDEWQPNSDQPLQTHTLTVEKAPVENVSLDELDNVPLGDYDPTLDLSTYKLPDIELLDDHGGEQTEVQEQELIDNKNKIVKTLEDYKIDIKSIKATVGPTVTLYEIVPSPGIRIAKIKSLEDDIALSLKALGIRIIAPIPGRGTIGIEVPNSCPEIVSMKSIITAKKFQNSTFELPIALGKTISNETYVLDLVKTPHMLVAGATGQGKSVGLNAILTSLLYKKHPSQLKFVLIDPKKVELNIYSTIERHFLAKLPDEEEPVITDVKRVVATLNSLTIEMDQRYELLKKAHTRNIKEYNSKFITRSLNPEKGHRFLPYIVVVVDEFADLIMTAGKEVELPIARIAQLARAVGIHMIIATQRPSVNVITGIIKANFPTRVAFKVAQMIDSRTILDSPGANQLIGRGDMLISQGNDLVRVQCAFVDTPEVDRIVNFIGSQRGYATAMILPEVAVEGSTPDSADLDPSKRDPMFEDAARCVVQNQSGSTSLIQRRFSIGYNRAGRIMDNLEKAGIVGPAEGSKPRNVLIPDEFELNRFLARMG